MKRYIKAAVVNPLDEEPGVRCDIARETEDLNLIDEFVKDDAYKVRLALANNPNISEDVLDSIISNEWNQEQLLHDSSTLPIVLRKIYNEYNTHYNRKDLAQHHNTPSDILSEIWKTERGLRGVILMNPNVSTELLWYAVNSENPHERSAVPFNSSATEDMLIKLSEDTDPEVLAAVASSPSTPIEILQKLAQDADAGVRISAKMTLRDLGEYTE